MIKFFRHIRQSLIQQNKMGKYFKYAIGEILLVVIGILLALQINNWNDLRKNRVYEREILTNKLTDQLLKQVNSGIHSDSLNNWLGKIISFERFKSQSSAFEDIMFT